MEETNRMGKISDLYKKIGDIKERVYVSMGTINDINGKDLKETAGIKKWWQEYTGKIIQKIILILQITTMVW